MEEPKKSNNSPTATPKNISTSNGILVVLVVAVIVGIGIFYFFRTNFTKEFSVEPESLKVPALREENPSSVLPDSEEIPTTAEVGDAESAGEETLDFDYELKKLDEQNNSVNPNDFDENEMSDTNVGL